MSLYVCENCGRAGEISTFNDDCRPGWTHGKLTKIESVKVNGPMVDRAEDAAVRRTGRSLGTLGTTHVIEAVFGQESS